MPDREESINRIIDMYDYYGFLQLVFGYDSLAEEIIEITDTDDVQEE